MKRKQAVLACHEEMTSNMAEMRNISSLSSEEREGAQRKESL